MDAVEALRLTHALQETQQAHWKKVRSLLMRLDIEGGHKALGYETFAAYVKGEFSKEHHNFSCERTCGKIEQALDIPLATYPAYALRPLKQFHAVAENYRRARDKSTELALLKECWERAKEIALNNYRELPNADDIISAKLWMHQQYPELIRKPTPKNGVEVWKQRFRAIEAIAEQLKKKLAEQETELQAYRKRNSETPLQRSELQREINFLRRSNQVLTAKYEQLLTANKNLSNRASLGVRR